MSESTRYRWYPIASAADLPLRHVFHAGLFGREFAAWRADDGFINVWENRCLHRGVRLSIGINDGRELKCQYHGWRYSNRTAGCTYIPAHPADAPARTITNRTFPAVERYGLVWSGEEPLGDVPVIGVLAGDSDLVLRAMPFNASAGDVVRALASYRFQPNGALSSDKATIQIEPQSDETLILRATEQGESTVVAFFVQPVDARRAVVRGVVSGPVTEEARMDILRHHNERLAYLRDAVEAFAPAETQPTELQPAFEPLPIELAGMPELTTHGRHAALRVVVARKWDTAEGIAAFELRPIKGLLPTFQPGAHIDVHMPNGEIRQYSITNGPGETDRFVIGVKLERESKGGSKCMHEVVRQGDVLAISEPRNNFPLRRDAVKTLLVAGGIGITPLLAMAQALHHSGLGYELHYFAQNTGQLAFGERLEQLGDGVRAHLGLSPAESAAEFQRLLAGYLQGMQVYICGPGPMLEAVRNAAADAGWPESTVHFEYFKNTNVIDDSTSFEIALARSSLTLTVPFGKSILEVLRENGVEMPSSCEEGACGTCLATVIEGEPDHQDVYLSPAERRSGTKILTCVSRAKSARLVLDI